MSTTSDCQNDGQDCWQSGFVKMLPQIERLLGHVFRGLDQEQRDEAIQNATVFCLLSFVRLHERGRASAVTASNLVWFAVLAVKSGRSACSRLSVREPLSRYAQLRRGITVKRLHTYDRRTKSWIDTVVEDNRARIPDVVAAKLDFRSWLATLCRRTRKIAGDLAKGCSTAETAAKYGVSPSRISQMRRELEKSWREFQHEPALILAQ